MENAEVSWMQPIPLPLFAHGWVFRIGEVLILRNQSYYEPYSKEPDKYAWIFDLWQE
jgi:hypothetical protein